MKAESTFQYRIELEVSTIFRQMAFDRHSGLESLLRTNCRLTHGFINLEPRANEIYIQILNAMVGLLYIIYAGVRHKLIQFISKHY